MSPQLSVLTFFFCIKHVAYLNRRFIIWLVCMLSMPCKTTPFELFMLSRYNHKPLCPLRRLSAIKLTQNSLSLETGKRNVNKMILQKMFHK